MNFRELLIRYNVPFKEHGEHHHTTDGWINIDCPYCSPSSGHFRMGYNLNNRFVSCWTCGGHSLWDTLCHLLKLPADECINLVGGLPKQQIKPWFEHEGVLQEPMGLKTLSAAHIEYLQYRGFNAPELQMLWHIAALGQETSLTMRWRIYIPIEFHSEVVSWTARSISRMAGRRRYVTASKEQSVIPSSRLLYGIDYVRNSAIIVEGPLDVWKIGPGAVALMGTNCTPAQFEQLARIPNRIICLDSDAQRRAEELCADLSIYEGTTKIVYLQTGKDACSADSSEVDELKGML